MQKQRLIFVERNSLLTAYYMGNEIAVMGTQGRTQEEKQQFCNGVACCVYRVIMRDEIRLCAIPTRSTSTTISGS